MGNPVVHFDINGTDTKPLIKFYSELFGWHIEHMSEMDYGMIDTHAGGGINGGVGTARDGSRGTVIYIEVDDCDAFLKKISKAGGKTVQETMTIPNVVTYALFTDPAGNRLGLVKSEPSSEAPGVSGGTSNPEVGWFEILGTDADALAKFYTKLFGWHSKRNEMGGGMIYNEIDTHSEGRGSNGGIGSSFDGQPHATVYAGVDDITKTLEVAESLGGKVVMPETKVTEQTIIGQFTDPQGNLFGLYNRMRG